MPIHEMSALEQYTSDLFAPEDAVLRELRAELPRRNIPEININAVEGRLLQFLLRTINARKALEIGSLGGYSGIWIARALPPNGKLITLEINPHHAATAREFYAKAGVADKVELREGTALDTLPGLTAEAPFDFCFIDADKPNQAAYLKHALQLVRPGGMIAVDNSYRHGSILDPQDHSPDVEGVRECNRLMASDPRLFSTIITTNDGLAVGLVKNLQRRDNMASTKEQEAVASAVAGVQDSAEMHPVAGEEAARVAAASSENGHDEHHAIATTKPKVHYSDLGLSADDLLKMYYYMLLARSLDERMWLLNRQGKIAFVISCQGHEGAQVGLAYALQPGKDFACPYYRDLGMMVTLGQTPRDVMLSVFGRAENTDSGGRQMPGHFGVRKLNVPTGSSPIATQNVHAAGVALAFKLRGIDGVCITSLGEGGTSQGDWHEAMNFAATMDLPMIMMVENNRYAISEPQERQMKIHNVADRAAAYGCPGVVVDGNDILDVYRASIEAVRRARAGEGPTLIEAKVNRFTPHSSDDDDKRYRDPNEVKLARAQQDPITLFHNLLMSEGVLTEEKDNEIREGIKRQVDDATDYALAAPDPRPEDLYTHVYADRVEATVESQYESLGE